MTLSELRKNLHDLVSMYFGTATVIYAKQSFIAKPENPLVTISTGSVNRPINPPTRIIDGKPVAFYPATVPVQIDLFTNGQQTEIAPGFTGVVENTAADDMISFCDFLNSLYVISWCQKRDMAIVIPNDVQDLTGLVHDTNYQFRAMLEITVYCTMTAIGYAGVLDANSIKHTGTTPDGKHYEYTGGDVQGDDVEEITPVIKPSVQPDTKQPDGTTDSGGSSAEEPKNNELIEEETNGYFEKVEVNDRIISKSSNS